MRKGKNIKCLIMALTLLIASSVSNIAQADSVKKESIIVPEGTTIEEVSLNEIPEGIVPLEFETVEEAQQYFDNFNNLVKEEKIKNDKLKKQFNTENVNVLSVSATNDIVEVASWGNIPITVYLKANYGTTGSAHTGYISYISPFTTYSALPFSSFQQTNIGYSISSNQKDAYIYASGIVSLYVVIEDIGNIYSQPIDLGRTCYLAR